MSEKVEARGDIAQLISGSVHEAPRLNNVVNLNLSEPQKETKFITGKQRKFINGLVKEWSSICGKNELEIYGIFMTDYGVKYFKDLPMEYYAEIKHRLECWIAESRKTTATSPWPHAISQRSEPKMVPTVTKQCEACAEKNRSYLRLQRQSRILLGSAIALAAACGVMLFKWPTLGTAAASSHCYFDGKPYSAGSTVIVAGGMVRECASDPSDGGMIWQRSH
ncbi:hypothetical protein [Herbaspirillum seropedicae]|uniref:hypothetical protein n=1 Tax=Herbaspirillum seropedicae TaxID=964 RepID=UPI003D97CF84